jgi:hypothetical protein
MNAYGHEFFIVAGGNAHFHIFHDFGMKVSQAD